MTRHSVNAQIEKAASYQDTPDSSHLQIARAQGFWRVHDPEGNPIDLSARGYNTIPVERLQGGDDGRTP
jgi:hypothetical protein